MKKSIALLLLTLSVGWSSAACGKPSDEQPPATTSTTTTAAGLTGSYSTGELSRDSIIDAGARLGFSADQIAAAFAQDQIDQSATWGLTFDDQNWTLRYDYGNDRGIGARGTYTVDGTTLALTEACCGTTDFNHEFDGRTLTFHFPSDIAQLCGDDVFCTLGVLIYGSAPFNRTD